MHLLIGFALSCWGAQAQWDVVDQMIEKFKFLPNASFSAGDAGGRRHTFEKGSLKMDTQIIMASSSKFPAAVAVAGAVRDGHLSFDTKVHDVFSWWTKDAKDNRSSVTLRHLLTFTSGLVSPDFAGGGVTCLSLAANATSYKPEDCAREIYEEGPKQQGAYWTMPGTIWSYHSMHLQIAGVMAAKAAGLELTELLSKYLIKPMNMTNTMWYGSPNPHLAAALLTTGNDYDKLLQGVLTYTILPKSIIDQMETDAYRTYPGLVPSQYIKDLALEFYGHYSMCLYFECVAQPWSKKCEQNAIHADPGAFGYWPLINREKGYYMNLVVYRPVTFNSSFMKKEHITPQILAALPGHCVGPLRFGLQPFVETALHKGAAEVTDTITEEGAYSHSTLPPDPLAALCKAAEEEVPPGELFIEDLLVV